MTDEQRGKLQAAFLDAFRVQGIISLAAKSAGVARCTVYEWLKHEAFAELFREAEEDARDVIRAEIHRRAVEGVDEPVYQKGQHVGDIRKYSDALLVRMSQARLPEYRPLAPTSQTPGEGVDEPAQRKVVVEIVEVADWGNLSRVKS